MDPMEIIRMVTGELGVNTLILKTAPHECAVVDPGADAPSIIARISAEGLTPAALLLTHGHWDHLGALSELALAWPEARIGIHPGDSTWLGPGALERHRSFFASLGASSLVSPDAGELPGSDLPLREGVSLCGWKVLETPGHSPGSVSLYCEGEGILLSGDTLFRGGYGRTDGPGGSDESLAQSLRRLLALPPDTRVIPGHGEETTIGGERDFYAL